MTDERDRLTIADEIIVYAESNRESLGGIHYQWLNQIAADVDYLEHPDSHSNEFRCEFRCEFLEEPCECTLCIEGHFHCPPMNEKGPRQLTFDANGPWEYGYPNCPRRQLGLRIEELAKHSIPPEHHCGGNFKGGVSDGGSELHFDKGKWQSVELSGGAVFISEWHDDIREALKDTRKQIEEKFASQEVQDRIMADEDLYESVKRAEKELRGKPKMPTHGSMKYGEAYLKAVSQSVKK